MSRPRLCGCAHDSFRRAAAIRDRGTSGLIVAAIFTSQSSWRLAFVNRPYATVGLVQRGYSDDDIANIMGGNHLRVFQAVLDGRKTLG